MAKAKTSSIISSLSGKINKIDGIVFRHRNGKQEVYFPLQKEKRAPMTEPQKQSATAFGGIAKLASLINKDPKASAEFRAAYLQLDRDHRPQILYRFILSSLRSDPSLVSKYQYLLQ